MHIQAKPSILYFGTPVVLISTKNEDDSDNLAPISSIFWLGWRCVIGIASSSKTTENLLRNRECVLNLPSVNEVSRINLLAKTTGSNPVPQGKLKKGYRHEKDKFKISGFNPTQSITVAPNRVAECPVQLEAKVEAVHGLGENDKLIAGNITIIELRILKVHIDEFIIMDETPDRIDPDKWRPIIMSFQQFYGLGNKLHYSTLSEISEELYNTSDREREGIY